MQLSKLKVGETAVVKNINLKGEILRRVMDIGLVEGTGVKCVMKSPLGDPTAYKIRGGLVALRSDDTSKIQVFKSGGVGRNEK